MPLGVFQEGGTWRNVFYRKTLRVWEVDWPRWPTPLPGQVDPRPEQFGQRDICSPGTTKFTGRPDQRE